MEIACVNRVNDFVGLFEQQPLEGIVVLLAVPRAALGSSEMRHQINKLREFFAGQSHSYPRQAATCTACPR
jgi:hypothetical protein